MTSVAANTKQTAPQVTTAMRAKAEENLRKAKVQLVLHQPFFASIILKRRITIDDKVPTAYITASGKIVCGTAFLSGLTVAESVFLLAHEAMHYAMMHQLRRGWRKQRPWNVAADYVINDILTKSGVGTPLKDGLHQAGASDFTAEQLYKEDKGGGGGGQGYEPGQGNDDLSDEGMGELDDEQIEEIKRELIQARTAAKSQGKMPAALEGVIDDIVNPITPWHQVLERYMLMLIKAGSSFRRPNKRFVAHDLYMPSKDRKPAMGTAVIQIDESGSIGDKELSHFVGHINKILEQCTPERLIILHTDTRVAKSEEYAPEDLPLKLKSYAGGGTDMSAGFDWCANEGIEPDVFVCLTDGYTPWGEAPGYPVVWLITGDKDIVAPHGESIYYEVNE